jgi:exopolysaccharide biosynthesis polyprenyl glycosylphosphotransferase
LNEDDAGGNNPPIFWIGKGNMASISSSKSTVVSKEKAVVDNVSWIVSRVIQWRLFTLSLVIVDGIAIGIAFWLAYFLRFELSLGFFSMEVDPSINFYKGFCLLLIPLWLFIFFVLQLYDRKNLLGGALEYERIFFSTTVGILLFIVVSFMISEFVFSRGWLLLFWVLAWFFLTLGRFTMRRCVYKLRSHNYFMSPTIIIGANNEGLSLADQLISWKTSGLKVIGFVDEKTPVGTIVCNKVPILGTTDKLDEIIKKYSVEELIMASSAYSSRDNYLAIFQRYGISGDINLRISSGLYEIITTGLTVKEFAYVPLVGINKVKLTGLDQFLKGLLDYLITLPLLVLLSPVFLIIAVLIKLDSPGPIFYRRRVLGINGRDFDAFKFRTMHVNGDEIMASHPELQSQLDTDYKLRDDPRVTRIGKTLRRTSLDEFPQLFNVLKRDMSLVGPRMITTDELKKYDKWYINLLTVRPGMTGLWQVSGRSNVSYEERVRLDMHYIRNWSIWFDIQLLFQTIPAVLKGKGAY